MLLKHNTQYVVLSQHWPLKCKTNYKMEPENIHSIRSHFVTLVTHNNSNKSQSLSIEKSSHVSSIPIWSETLPSILMPQKELKNILTKSSVPVATLILWVSHQSEELFLTISADKIMSRHHQLTISSLLKALHKEFISFWKL